MRFPKAVDLAITLFLTINSPEAGLAQTVPVGGPRPAAGYTGVDGYAKQTPQMGNYRNAAKRMREAECPILWFETVIFDHGGGSSSRQDGLDDDIQQKPTGQG